MDDYRRKGFENLLGREIKFMQNKTVDTDKGILGGTPVFKGTLVPVSILFDYLEDNRMNEFLENYPSVSKKQVSEVIKMASKLFKDEEIIDENLN